uniref:histidine kinase n=1 Tax=Nitratidesulfovibrio vulgaris (strain DSM 19637 / Miyazaki F) TaxID=883 RepID=B8DQS3_NITV9
MSNTTASKGISVPDIIKGRSLSRDLTVSLVVMVLVVVAALFSFVYVQISRDMLHEVDRKADEYITRLADILSIPMWNFDARTMDQIGSVFAQYELINEIHIEDAQGNTLFRVRKGADPDATVFRERAVRFESEVIGRVSMVVTLQEYRRSLERLLKASALIMGSVLVVLLASTGVLLRVFLRRPLEALRSGMDQIARGDFAYDMGSIAHAELAQIAENFSRMCSQVEQRENELHAINTKLQDEIQSRRQTELALRASEERYALVVGGTSDGIWDWDLTTNTVYFSPRWKSIIGYEDHEIPNRPDEWKGRVHPDDLDAVLHAHDDYLARRVPEFQVEYRMRHKDDSYRWILGRGAALWDVNGVPVRMAGAHTDITTRKEVEQELREAKNNLDNILNAMPSIIVGVDQAGSITLWNRTAERVTSLSRDAVLGRPVGEALPDFGFLLDEIRRSIAEGGTIALDKTPVPGPGVTRYFDIVIYPVVSRGSFGAVVRLDDITGRIRIEEMMVQTEKMLSVGGLAAGMAHEINNPLGGILQGAQNIQRRLDPDFAPNVVAAEESGCSMDSIRGYLDRRGILRFLEGIRESGNRAANIVSNMLEFSRRSESRWQRVSLPYLVDRTLELAANDYDLKKKYDFRHIDIVRDFAADLPDLPCMPTEIEQVLLNLFKNAAQAMHLRGDRPDPPRISVSLRHEGGMLRIDVADNGPGMEEDVRRRVFEPFFTTKSVGEGTGLGLSVSYFIITTNHGGTFTVESEPGRGTVFTLRLPVDQRHVTT